jgi:triosephosphate isomerase
LIFPEGVAKLAGSSNKEFVMRQPLVAGNWKMNGSLDSVTRLVTGIQAGLDAVTTAELAVCPPYVYIPQVASLLEGTAISLGAQDVNDRESGAHTGEVAANMLTDVGCRYVIVGHSERRSLYGESDEFTARKFTAARRAGLVPILCVGETLKEREQGITEQVVARQLDAVVEREGIAAIGDCVIAYEPVWAIGTGKTATPDQAQEVHAFIRGRLAALDSGVADQVRILYGGSMNPGNAAELLAMGDIDGGLIGGASLKPDDFLAIGRAANA